MTYDLGAFGKQNEPRRLPDLYVKACNSDISQIRDSQEMPLFIEAINKLYPDPDTIPDSEADNCPWAIGFDQSNKHWIACMSFSFVKETIPKIIELALKYNVYIFDPQEDKVIG